MISVESLLRRMQVQAKEGAQEQWRQELALRVAYYDGRQRADLEQAIEERYPLTASRLVKFAEYYNLTREVVDARAKAYYRNPDREIRVGDSPAPDAVQDVWSYLIEAGELDNVQRKTDKKVCLLKTAIVWPRFRRRGTKEWIKWEVVSPQSMWVIQSIENPDELADAEEVIILLGGRTETMQAEESRFARYSQTEYSEFVGTIEGGYPCPRKTIVEPKPHGYGRIPLTPFYDGMPDGELLITRGNEVIDANRAVNVKRTDLAYLTAMQSHGQLVVVSDDDKAEYPIGPDVVLKLDAVEGTKAEFIQPGARLLEAREIVEWALKTDAAAEGLTPNRFSTGDRQALSGVAKMLDELDLIEDINIRQQLYLTREADLFDATRAVWNEHSSGGRKLPEDARQVVTFIPYSIPLGAEEETRTLDMQIANGSVPAWTGVKRLNPGLTDQEAEDQWRENIALIKESSAAKSPLGGVFARRPKPPEPDDA